MRKIVFASCFWVTLMLPLTGFGSGMKWSGVLYLKGTGATNCGKARINNDAWDRCEAWARQSIKGDKKPVIKDIELYNIAIDKDPGAKLSCNFRASVKCGYRLEQISKKERLKLSKGIKLKGAGAESCSEPSADKIVADDCAVGADNKKPVELKGKAKVKASARAASAEKMRPKSGEKKMKLFASAARKQKVGKNRSAKQAAEMPQWLKQIAARGAVLAAASWNNNSRSTTPPAVLPKWLEQAAARGAALAAASWSTQPSLVLPKTPLKWSAALQVKGSGITNCGKSLISGEAWEICEAWAEENKGRKGFAVKPEVHEIDLYNIAVANGRPTARDPNPSCSFRAEVKCGYSTAAELVEHPAAEAASGGDPSTVNYHSDLDNLFGDSLRWSKLLAIDGTGITNCGEPRIKNEAWDTCERWAAEQKTIRRSTKLLRPVLKNVELYNIASEHETGTSWAPKQRCSFHATLKCGYMLE